MFDEVDSMVESRQRSVCIRLNPDHRDRCRAALLLKAVGGHRVLRAEETVYRLITCVARDEALSLLRGRFGPAIATALDVRPWLPGDSRQSPRLARRHPWTSDPIQG